jgi:hypothetical protein
MVINEITFVDGSKYTLQEHIKNNGKKLCVYVSENGQTRLPFKRIEKLLGNGAHTVHPTKFSKNAFYRNILKYSEYELQLLKDIPKDKNLAILHIKNKSLGIRLLCEETLNGA